jgi:hypothetical protein
MGRSKVRVGRPDFVRIHVDPFEGIPIMTRDTRDPQQLGEAILSMSADHGMSVLRAADIFTGSWERPENSGAGLAEAGAPGPEADPRTVEPTLGASQNGSPEKPQP